KRLSITDCVTATVGPLNACFQLANNIRPIGSNIASFIFSRASANDCSVHTGTIDGVQWRYTATGSSCDTTAQLTTIRGAIDAFLKETVDNKCINVCLRMTHGGTWTGYLLVTPAGA
ncbi:hypothetical protein C8R44DRAFT_574860, partial [Mycena epipterygia]